MSDLYLNECPDCGADLFTEEFDKKWCPECDEYKR